MRPKADTERRGGGEHFWLGMNTTKREREPFLSSFVRSSEGTADPTKSSRFDRGMSKMMANLPVQRSRWTGMWTVFWQPTLGLLLHAWRLYDYAYSVFFKVGGVTVVMVL